MPNLCNKMLVLSIIWDKWGGKGEKYFKKKNQLRY